VRIEVELLTDGNGESVPTRLRLGEDWLPVTTVIDRWLAREHRYFKVSVGPDRYIVRQDVPKGVWDLTFFLANGSR
jgi:hypothetical protein